MEAAQRDGRHAATKVSMGRIFALSGVEYICLRQPRAVNINRP